MGLLYGANTVGAVFGCLLAGFYLLRVLRYGDRHLCRRRDQRRGRAGQLLRSRKTLRRIAPQLTMPARIAKRGAWPVYVTIALSGATRARRRSRSGRGCSACMLGATVYTFSIILAVFLVGLGDRQLGAAPCWRAAHESARALLGWCQMLLAAAIAWTAWHARQFAALLARQSAALHQPLVSPSRSTWRAASGRFCRRRCCGAPASRWRLLLPRRQEGDPGRLVGGIYAANTGGAILGALGFSLVLVPWIGTQRQRSGC